MYLYTVHCTVYILLTTCNTNTLHIGDYSHFVLSTVYTFARCCLKLRYHNFVSMGVYNYIPHEIMHVKYEKMIYVYCLIIGVNFNAEYKQPLIFD